MGVPVAAEEASDLSQQQQQVFPLSSTVVEEDCDPSDSDSAFLLQNKPFLSHVQSGPVQQQQEDAAVVDVGHTTAAGADDDAQPQATNVLTALHRSASHTHA